jgi:hypothetical protein
VFVQETKRWEISEMKRLKSWWGKRAIWQKIGMGVLAVGLVAAPFVDTAAKEPTVTTVAVAADSSVSTTTVAESATSTTATTKAPTTTASQFTRSEENAIRSAESYLDYTAFSRSGLIDQLEYEGFTNAEATLAVDYLDADWNEQAWLSAESYLEYTAFSRSGLIDQLEYEGFTTAQATYGVDEAGL